MVDGPNVEQLKEMLTIVCPDPNGNIDIGMRGPVDNLKRILVLMGFEFMTLVEAEYEEHKKELDPDGTGNVKIDDFARFLDNYVSECTNEQALTEAFKQFDADDDNKLSMEEFEFFMTGFAKECNNMMDGKMVQSMLDIIYREKVATEEEPKMFDITEMVTKMKSVWAAWKAKDSFPV